MGEGKVDSCLVHVEDQAHKSLNRLLGLHRGSGTQNMKTDCFLHVEDQAHKSLNRLLGLHVCIEDQAQNMKTD
jgi:hypothetical protein